MSDEAMRERRGCDVCTTLHVARGDLYDVIAREKRQGKWHAVSAEEAVRACLRVVHCGCACHDSNRVRNAIRNRPQS